MSAHTDNTVTIAADLDFVWTMTNDLARWPDLFTEYASVEIIEQRENTFRFRLTMNPDEEGRVWSWVSERTLDPAGHRVRALRIEPGPFEFMRIEWTYQAVDGGTEMRWRQDFAMRPNAPVDDAGMAARINRNSPREMAAIKAKVEEAFRASTAAIG